MGKPQKYDVELKKPLIKKDTLHIQNSQIGKTNLSGQKSEHWLPMRGNYWKIFRVRELFYIVRQWSHLSKLIELYS